MVAENIDLQAAAAKIDDATRGRIRPQRSNGGFAAQTRFLGAADHFEGDAAFSLDLAEELFAIAGFAGGARGYGAVLGYAVFLHHFLEMAKGFHALLENILGEAVAQEHAFAQAKGVALVVEGLDVQGGVSSGDGEADGVRACVDRGDVDGLGHSWWLPPEMRKRRRRRVFGGANSQAFADSLAQLLVYGGDAGLAVEFDEIVALGHDFEFALDHGLVADE